MAELPNARIIELDEINVVNAGSFLVIYDIIAGVTYKIKADLFVATTDQNFDWTSGNVYALDEVVTYGGKWWQSLQNGNLAHIPTEGVWWTELSKSPAFGLHANGIYSEANVFVLKDVDGFKQLFRLANATRPYVSSDFNAEWAAGDWELASERGYFIVNKTGHGWAVNTQLTFKTGAWNTFTTGDQKLGIVRAVIDADNVLVVAQGQLLKNMSGLTAGVLYYAQSDGTITTTVSDDPVFLAISTTSAVLLGAGGVSGSLPDASETVAGKVEEATDAEMESGTTTGGTGAKLFVTPAKLATWWTWIKTQAQTFTGRLIGKHTASGYGTLTDASTIAWNADSIGNIATVTLGGNRTLGNITNPISGALYTLRVVQDGTGGRALAFDTGYSFPGSIAPYINPAASAQTILQFFYDGSAFRYVLPSNGHRLGDLFIENQKATGSNQRPVFIDSTGRVQKSGFVNHDETEQYTETTGKDTLHSLIARWRNSAFQAVAEIYNDFFFHVKGTVFHLEVPDEITDGNADIVVNTGHSVALRAKDKSSNPYWSIKSDTTEFGRAFRQEQARLIQTSLGFKTWEVPFSITTTTTNNGQNTLVTIPIPTDHAATVTILEAHAYATNNSLQSCNVVRTICKNVAGTLTRDSDVDTIVPIRLATTSSGGFNFATSGTDLLVRFQNETTGREYKVSGILLITIIPLPEAA